MAQSQYVVISLLGPTPHGCHIVREDEFFLAIYRVVYGPKSFWECSEWLIFNCKPIPPWWDDEKTGIDRRNAEIRKRHPDAAKMLSFATRKVEIGHINGVPEVKIEWEGHPIPHPVIYHRDSKITAYAEFSAPDIDAIWGDITSCAVGAAVAATLAAIIASPAAALPAFKAAFMACIVPKIGDRAKEISVALSTQQEHGDWHRV